MSIRLAALAVLIGAIGVGTLRDSIPTRQPIHVDGYEVLAGDFHVHAFVGDGGIAPWMLQRQAARVGLDVIAVTNHNQTFAGRLGRWAARRSPGPMIIAGEEITGRDFHLIAVGVEQAVDWNQSSGAAIDQVHAQGGVAIAAHPLRGFTGYDDRAVGQLDGVEAAHPDSLDPEIGRQFEEFYGRSLGLNPEVAAIGSSDFHTDGPLGSCRTYLLVRERSEVAVIDAIREGRTVGRCLNGELHGRPDLVRLLEPHTRALAAPPEDPPSLAAAMTVWMALFALAVLGPRRSA